MALITVSDVQSWFTDDRLRLAPEQDNLPEETDVSNEVLARVSVRYDTTTWVDPDTTPALIRSVISARVGSIRYRKVYADQLEEGPNYADWLYDEWSETTLMGIIDGQIPLLDAADLSTAQANAGPKFFPTDASSVDDPAVFSMGKTF